MAQKIKQHKYAKKNTYNYRFSIHSRGVKDGLHVLI